jgi:hypothetical protein
MQEEQPAVADTEGSSDKGRDFWAQFSVHQFRFRLTWISSVTLPPFKGSAFRGVLGFALRAIVCPYDTSSVCQSCPVASACPYAILYESIPTGVERAGRFRDTPKPFVIVPPLTSKTQYIPGDNTEFDVMLVGEAVALLPAIAAAFSLVGLRGFRDTDGRFRLDSIHTVDSQGEMAWCEHPEPQPTWFADRWTDADLAALPGFWSGGFSSAIPHSVSLSFLTPLRVCKKGHLVAEGLPFDFLMDRLCERTWLLGALYCGARMPNCDDLIQSSKRVIATDSDLKWFDWKRTSIRSGKVDFGGLVGTVTYQGNLAPFLPFLELGALMGVGQGTTMGMGRYAMLFEQ